MSAWLLALPLVVGCASERVTFEQVLPSEGVEDVFCDIERGSFVYSGSSPGEFRVEVVSWARDLTGARAGGRIETNQWGAAVSESRLDLWGRSPAPRAGVDLILEGPPEQGVEAVLLDGVVQLYGVSGAHTVTADAIFGRGISGDLDLYAAAGGVDLEARPEPGQSLKIESHGPVTLALPYGIALDLEVLADPEWGVEVSDLGFDQLSSHPDYVRAVSGTGAIPIDIQVIGGRFTLWNADL